MDPSSSGATIAVRPDGRRRINLPSDVIPVTRLRTERIRPCEEDAAELRLARVRLDFDATDFGALCELDWVEPVGGGSLFACADELMSGASEPEVVGVGTAEFSVELTEAAPCGCVVAI